jgi:His/Glu/Gln/Arg/opine family amino acid ABC transporter permease subunit
VSELAGWGDDYFWGAMVILRIFAVSLVLSVIFGLIGSAMKLSGNRAAETLANAYTVVFRGTPELLVLLIVYFGAAVTLTTIAQSFDPSIKFIEVPPFWAGAFAIALIVGAYMTETFRGAFLGVDPGLVEAARALGLSKFQTFVYVRVPQMWRLALPNFGNHMLSLMKDTALISVIGVEEIVFVAEMATTVTLKPFTMYIVVALIYLCITTVITLTVMALEKYANKHLATSR